MPPAARVTDNVAHPLPPVLSPGPGSLTVLIGGLPAWRGIPTAAAAGLQVAKQASEIVIKTAQAATVAAAGTPGLPAAKAAEEAAKTASSVAMSSAISAVSAGADIHACVTPFPIPPHGPGVVIDGSPTVLINNLPAARLGDTILEPIGPPNKIVKGCPTVLIGQVGKGRPVTVVTAAVPIAKTAMTEAEAQQLMDDFKKTDIPFDYPPDCCYSRARKMCDIMEKKGFESKKLWSEGRLNATKPDGSAVSFPDENGVPTPVTWHYHVAPVVDVQTPDGKTGPRILDPSLSDKPLTVDEWKKLCNSSVPTTDKVTPPAEHYPFHPSTAGKEYTVAEADAQMQEHRETRDRNRAAAGSTP